MNLRGRVLRLQARARGAGLEERCPVCRGPRPDGKTYHVCSDRSALAECETCGRFLDEDGIPLGRPGSGHVKILILPEEQVAELA